MLYTIIGDEVLLKSPDVQEEIPLHSLKWNQVDMVVEESGRVRTILSTDPNVFLKFHDKYPCGQISG